MFYDVVTVKVMETPPNFLSQYR